MPRVERLEGRVLGLETDPTVLPEEALHRRLVRSLVVALAGNDETADEAWVKRFFRVEGRIRLQSANSSLAPLYPRHVQIIGKVIGVFRRV